MVSFFNDKVEFRSLTLATRHGINGFMFGKQVGWEPYDTSGAVREINMGAFKVKYFLYPSYLAVQPVDKCQHLGDGPI